MPENEVDDQVCINVGGKLIGKLNGLSFSPSKCFIFRVHDQLRNVNEKSYEPNIIAVGPYHHGKDNLQMMEEHKLRYLRSLLKVKKEEVYKYISAMRSLEVEIRRCYIEPLNLDENQLVEMIVLDGCFIVELIRKFTMPNLRERNDPIFEVEWIVNCLQRDLLLFENQLPFFVLCKLFDMIEVPQNHNRFIYLALQFFGDLFPGHGNKGSVDGNSKPRIRHLLDLVHRNWLPPFALIQPTGVPNKERNWRFIPSATELLEAGIKLKKVEGNNSFDIKFEKGVLQIPALTIEDRTESFFRNLIAHEQYNQGNHIHFIGDYVKFIDCLIDTSKDVEIICREGIIDNWLGDTDAVATMINKMNESVTGGGEHFHYAKTFNKINIHCGKRRHRWMAKLRRNYLSSPWAILSVLAAFVLLVLTILQTVYTVMG